VISAAADLARRLARDAEAVCRHYLSRGSRCGRYWVIGDVQNTPGRSLYVRLSGPDYGPGAAGKWTDAATGEHGDLLDLIALNRDLPRLGEVLDEARLFLALPRPAASGFIPPRSAQIRGEGGSSEAARRLFRAARPVPGTPAEAYLRARGITAPLDWPALRYHPSVYYRDSRDAELELWPALLAAVTAWDGTISGVQRTWLDRDRPAKAPLSDPRRALGLLLGNGVRFGKPTDILAAGEGIETMLALKSVLPDLPVIAGLSANHLAALDFPSSLRRLYVARDNDKAGLHAAERLRERQRGIEVRELVPVHADFNLDLCRLGPEDLAARLADQLVPADRPRFLTGLDADPH
jgi:Toprim domain